MNSGFSYVPVAESVKAQVAPPIKMDVLGSNPGMANRNKTCKYEKPYTGQKKYGGLATKNINFRHNTN